MPFEDSQEKNCKAAAAYPWKIINWWDRKRSDFFVSFPRAEYRDAYKFRVHIQLVSSLAYIQFAAMICIKNPTIVDDSRTHTILSQFFPPRIDAECVRNKSIEWTEGKNQQIMLKFTPTMRSRVRMEWESAISLRRRKEMNFFLCILYNIMYIHRLARCPFNAPNNADTVSRLRKIKAKKRVKRRDDTEAARTAHTAREQVVFGCHHCSIYI